mgnify:CR=1 FL=1
MVKRTVQSTAIQFGFPTDEEKNGEIVYNKKTISNLNGLATDDDIKAVANEIAPLFKELPELTYRVDTVALEAA